MPIETMIDKESGIIIRTMIGDFTFEEIRSSFEALIDHHDFDKDLPVLWDFRKTDARNIYKKEIKSIVAFYESQSERRSGIKVAFVVPSDFEYGIARMFEAHALYVPAEIEIFRNYEDAMAWLLE